MNTLKKIAILTLTTVIVLSIASCKKSKSNIHPKEPCNNKVLVTALMAFGEEGHFEYNDQKGSIIWLYATNFSEYATKVKPGYLYEMAFEEMKCRNWCGTTTENKIIGGGCVIYPRKCIRIICLKPVENIRVNNNGCFESKIDDPAYSDFSSDVLGNARIVDDMLKVKVGFSGCSVTDPQKFVLQLKQMPPDNKGNEVFEGKVVNTFEGFTCKAFFTKEICLNLNQLRSRFYSMHYKFQTGKVIIFLKEMNGTTRLEWLAH